MPFVSPFIPPLRVRERAKRKEQKVFADEEMESVWKKATIKYTPKERESKKRGNGNVEQNKR